MGRSRSSQSLPLFQSLPWNAQIGRVFQSIGTPFFHEELIDLMKITVETDAFWIIRYSGEAAPDVVFTRGVSPHTERVYSRKCAPIDPFSARWRNLREAGIFTLGRLRANDPTCTSYSEIFLRAAGMDDELGIILPISADNCFAIFLERKHGLFSDNDVRILETLYPAIDGCCRSHLRWLFDDVKSTENSPTAPALPRPTAIFDRAGHHVYSDASWIKAAHRFPALKQQAAKLAVGGGAESRLDDWVLRAERLTPDFPLAPNGTILILERVTIALPNKANNNFDVFSEFTRRERDVLRLVLRGKSNADISAELGIGLGSIRNIKLRLYRKSGVSSESELVAKLITFESSL
ncbi:response regulator transcription factor [Methylorubrum populi]|uniref:response regulator transcription factor n=1 Tax=Methylorubrum populi TaxID=223967 RepID=UPI000DB890F1|nr:helix-turn-helix transcriptional regulator [Methylorubrum populi]MRI56904.1 LuxR family transcriptional regulator [Methylobacterium sp. DB1607]PZP69802.1 MAG: hypothetical protein DI590_11865 [Methylorubrum populi]